MFAQHLLTRVSQKFIATYEKRFPDSQGFIDMDVLIRTCFDFKNSISEITSVSKPPTDESGLPNFRYAKEYSTLVGVLPINLEGFDIMVERCDA